MPKRSGPNAGSATRDAVLEAARRLFTERGFDGTSMRDIAGELGLSNAALYYHFPSKDSILAALSQTRRDEIDALAQWARAQQPRAGLLRETALRWVDGATAQRLESMRLAQAIRPALARAVSDEASVPGGFEALVEVFAHGEDPIERLRVRLVFDAFGCASRVGVPGDDLSTIVAAARLMVIGLTELADAQPC